MTEARPQRSDFPHVREIATRWMDNDVYGHLNNVVYYSLFDTAVNQYLIEAGVLDIERSPAFGVVVETGCKYFASLAYPDRAAVGVRCAHLGRTSVQYEVAVFRNDETAPAALGRFVHVYVDRDSRKPTQIPDDVRAALTAIQ